ncbi:uncharacterized protein MONBRDRAFT_32888 [Monosiga brevicollis MX1]|uniref:Uncharacterized protein n=1 Tax=Monosiga brevicollis TaxID=81824 RepID=A9V2B1_MONBE|nr:uncharacterized protein MONBRDRAFT_32888 [Monosiga brevicollis MX1]EDQ88343.1 predicted protein [Monosiga brevicollis MX1]|eukprot:XP_001746936.1 hypothetical protein [Monosiga brevicollis MX1]
MTFSDFLRYFTIIDVCKIPLKPQDRSVATCNVPRSIEHPHFGFLIVPKVDMTHIDISLMLHENHLLGRDEPSSFMHLVIVEVDAQLVPLHFMVTTTPQPIFMHLAYCPMKLRAGHRYLAMPMSYHAYLQEGSWARRQSEKFVLAVYAEPRTVALQRVSLSHSDVARIICLMCVEKGKEVPLVKSAGSIKIFQYENLLVAMNLDRRTNFEVEVQIDAKNYRSTRLSQDLDFHAMLEPGSSAFMAAYVPEDLRQPSNFKMKKVQVAATADTGQDGTEARVPRLHAPFRDIHEPAICLKLSSCWAWLRPSHRKGATH